MILCKPSAPFDVIEPQGDSIVIDTKGKVLVLPTNDGSKLPLINEYVLNSNRLSIAESPWGGLKGAGSPDYCPGSVYTESEGIYITDTSGSNSTKNMPAGKLAELGLLTVDTANHAITEEFIIRNDGVGSDVTVIGSCGSADGWGFQSGSGTITSENGRLKVTGTSGSNGLFAVWKSVSLDLSSYRYFGFSLESPIDAKIRATLKTSDVVMITWEYVSRLSVKANVKTKFVLPVNPGDNTSGESYPTRRSPDYDDSSISLLVVGIYGAPSTTYTFYVDDIIAMNENHSQVEISVPDNLSDVSLSLYTHNGTAYNLCSTHSLDGVYSLKSQTSTNYAFADGTRFDDISRRSGVYKSIFPKGSAGETITGSDGTILYSNIKGTSKRIGLKIDIPPTENGRTNLNKVRLKTVINYAPDNHGLYSASFGLDDSTDASYGLQNLVSPWLALYDPASSLIDFYLFTHRPHSMSFKRDESGEICQLCLSPGNGSIYYGQTVYADPTIDSDSDSIPDCLDSNIAGSIKNLLKTYGMVV
jgi:hypothetical protein